MGIIELPGLLASVWTWLFIYHVIKQTQKKEAKALTRRLSMEEEVLTSTGSLARCAPGTWGIALHTFSRDHVESIVSLVFVPCGKRKNAHARSGTRTSIIISHDIY